MSHDITAQRARLRRYRAHAASSMIAGLDASTGLPRPATSRLNIAVASTTSVLTPRLPLVLRCSATCAGLNSTASHADGNTTGANNGR